MNRDLHPKYYPGLMCPKPKALVDTYMLPRKPPALYHEYRSPLMVPVYSCDGWIDYSLPLSRYPPSDGYDSSIKYNPCQYVRR